MEFTPADNLRPVFCPYCGLQLGDGAQLLQLDGHAISPDWIVVHGVRIGSGGVLEPTKKAGKTLCESCALNRRGKDRLAADAEGRAAQVTKTDLSRGLLGDAPEAEPDE